ncbi:MAG: cation:H+ antiporter [Halobacteriales archaeon]|jgi:cation:H+ antiporter
MQTPLPIVPLSTATPVVNTVLLLGAFGLLLIGAEIFTNGVEWLGNRLGVSESATGSILAAVGTALPETMIPVIAILSARFGSGSQSAADSVGVGAILGAPFMLATIAMFLIGVSVLYFSNRRSYGKAFHFNDVSTRRDLTFFLTGYTLAFAAALIHSEIITTAIGILLVALYLTYLYRTLSAGGLVGSDDLEDLLVGRVVQKGRKPIPQIGANGNYASNPGTGITLFQTLFALGIIIAGAHLFVQEVEWAAGAIGVPSAIVALLLAPLATELPEKFNSILWISRDKDTLAIGNITGAMAFQGTLPVTLGILFTSWNLTLEWGTSGFLNSFSAILAIISGGILYMRARNVEQGNMHPRPFLIGGLFYLLFLIITVYHVVILNVSAAGGH